MRADLAARLGQIHWNLHPLWELAPRVDHKNDGLVESNLLSLSYGQVVRKDINEIGGLRPDSYETYNIIDSGDTVLRMTDLQNDQRSIRTGLATERGIITSAYITVRPDCDKVEPRFLHSVLRSYDIKKTFYEMGAGVRQTLKYAELADLPIPLPPRDTQRAIADYLDRETGEIDAMIAKMDELAARLRLRRDRAIGDVIDPYYQQVTVPLTFVSDPENFFDGDWVESKDQDPEGDIRLLQLADIGVGEFMDKSNRWINDDAFARLQCREVFPGDILIARMPDPLGRACLLPEGLGRTITVVDVAVLRPDPAAILPAYLIYVLNGPAFRSLVNSLQSGSTRQRISRSRLGQQRVPVPSLDEQRRIADHLEEVTGKIDAMLAKVAELKSLLIERRAALITDVVTGRKKVA